MPAPAASLADRLVRMIVRDRRAAGRSLLIGICGPQGAGKSTLAAAIARRLGESGLAVAILSLDDLYLGRAARVRLAQDVHPLLATRGVPGTHDVARGEAVIAALLGGPGPVAVPRFDKARDDPGAIEAVAAPVDVLIFEGWCVGATPQTEAALAVPVNALELAEDRDGRWRRHVDRALAGGYARLFARIDRLIVLRTADFAVVTGWRAEQEAGLGMARGFADAEIPRFVAHFERLTRHLAAGGFITDARLPTVVVDLDPGRRVTAFHEAGQPASEAGG